VNSKTLRFAFPSPGHLNSRSRALSAWQELNIGEACQRAMDAVLEEDWQVAGEAVMAANAFAEMRETMAAASSEEAATFAAKAAMEKRAAVIPCVP
jgi:hypothetical protein